MEINLYEEVLGGTWEAIASGRVDIAVGVSNLPTNTQGFRTQQLLEVGWGFMVAPQHPLATGPQPVTEQDLIAHRAIVARDSSRHLPPLTRNILQQQPILSVATLDQKISAQIQGLGCGYLPRPQVQQALAQVN